MPLNHAKHNYEVCLFLYKDTKYNDWIITTAYYAAIHFVYYKLFPNRYENPLTGNIKNFNSFKEYCLCLEPSCNKHKATENLVLDYLPEIHFDFQTFKENCWTARYDNYVVLDPIVDQCINGLKLIAKFCEDINN